LLGLLIDNIFSFSKWKRTEKEQLRWDQITLRLWVAGPLTRKIVIARFSRTLGTLMASGVPLLDAMDIAKSVTNNAVYENLIEEARVAIRDGESIANALSVSNRFPPMVLQMIAIGERTGEVESMLDKVAASYELQADTTISRLMVLLEPFLILFLGGMVAAIVFAIILPMLEMNNALRGNR